MTYVYKYKVNPVSLFSSIHYLIPVFQSNKKTSNNSKATRRTNLALKNNVY